MDSLLNKKQSYRRKKLHSENFHRVFSSQHCCKYNSNTKNAIPILSKQNSCKFSSPGCECFSNHRFSKQKDLNDFNIKGFRKIAIHFMPHNIV